ncbi:sugar phosphate nucleotidyltransferase [Arcicella rosea]|uniref:Glucose-1-phosphate thymidylyltransferase/glucose-1-phosphate adenylyltransferase n=1 Tax=Arcicella rosea TaxID=502909 RepID=A0A841EMB5_9BACT|nr:sugar phosphate nucleotidyltransferase [Arcicella rosea]MBB6002559.1 glucose-1-phosphate thymidylyltransferase/glucose-1-phosphate adenylyltransferase [Arcicella rosea]
MKKRILILAGGVASRMKKVAENVEVAQELIEQADTLTKGMIGLGKAGKSLIDYQLFNAHLAGFEEILLLLHPNDDFTQAYYETQMLNNDTWGLKISFARQYIDSDREKPAGTADAVYQALSQHSDWQKGQILILNSDNLYSQKAMEALWSCPANNALISYNRDFLEFPPERIKAFAVIRTSEGNYLESIIEKPSEGIIEHLLKETGRVGVSMNAFMVNTEQLLPFLKVTPFHPVRNEKELPTSISMMVFQDTKAVKCIPLDENVPDLTSKHDLATVQEYLRKNYQF